ncbi:hypothetical protein [Grimontia hollisae]|uniref:hypothetical protein n=1 Tax=Grimontia hollisae TaxID=673 RepID=UPI000E050BDB|nr:hypothetical protein [Grimontia hollisae]STQ75512.1 Uncharacterised protein [Grimontia hollisae]
MKKPPFNPPLKGFKQVSTREALALYQVEDMTCKHVFASECGCADIYTYSKKGEVLAVELVQLLTVSEWWVKETANDH